MHVAASINAVALPDEMKGKHHVLYFISHAHIDPRCDMAGRYFNSFVVFFFGWWGVLHICCLSFQVTGDFHLQQRFGLVSVSIELILAHTGV